MENESEVEWRLRQQPRKIEYCSKQAEKEFGNFPGAIRDQFLIAMENISWGLDPSLMVSHLAAVGKGVMEIKKNGSPAYRLVYSTKFADKLVVLVARPKTAQGQDKTLIETAALRLRDYQR